jgi:hypothetical protein
MVCDVWTDRLSGLFPSHVLQYNTLRFGESFFFWGGGKKQTRRRGPILFPKRSTLYCNAHDYKPQTVYGFKSIQRLMNLRWCMCRHVYVYAQQNALNMLVQAPTLGLTRPEMNTAYTCFSQFYDYLSYSYKYKQYIVKHNSVILLRCISYIVSFSDMFRI